MKNPKRKKKKKLREQKSRISGSQIVAGGIVGAGVLATVGAMMLVIGIILTFTIIGAIIGIPIALIGLIIVVASIVVGGVGVVGGTIKGIIDYFRGRKRATKHKILTEREGQKLKENLILAGLVFIGIILLPFYLIGVIPLCYAVYRWKKRKKKR